jgi:hypothetical protein
LIGWLRSLVEKTPWFGSNARVAELVDAYV